MKAIYFDMDGTIANLYALPNWEPRLRAEDASVYAEAEPMVDMSELATLLQTKQAQGILIGVISWLSMGGSKEFNQAVRLVKREWLKTHLPNVNFDKIHLVKYGTPKHHTATEKEGAILFDDNEKVRASWRNGRAYNEQEIFDILR